MTTRSVAPRSLVVIAYDIASDTRRRRAADLILSYGGRVQASVYELFLTQRQLERLWARLGDLVAGDDVVRCYLLCDSCRQRVRSYNMDEPEDDVAFVI